MRSLAMDALRVLGDGSPLGIARLAGSCGASRGELARCLASLARSGFVRIDGGCASVSGTFDFLDASAIREQLGAAAGVLATEVLDACPSTNALLLERVAEGANGPALLLAEEQTAGRGRRGGSWLSPVGCGLTLSMLRRMTCGPGNLAGLSLACGVALVRSLHALGIRDLGLKWPNDLLSGGPKPGAKLGGILVESRIRGDRADVVVGIGLNCRASPGLGARLRRRVASLQDLGAPPSRNALAASIARELLAALGEFDAAGLAAFRDEWEGLHAQAGRHLRVRLADGSLLAGIAGGIAEDGGLLLRARSGLHSVRSGHVLSARAA